MRGPGFSGRGGYGSGYNGNLSSAGIVPLDGVMEDEEEDGGESRNRVIICMNVLPVLLSRSHTKRWSCEFNTECLSKNGPMFVCMREIEGTDILYVGVPNAFVPDGEHDEVEALLARYNCYPVWCGAKRAHNYFQGYCKGILWPTFHNVLDLYSQHQPTEMLCMSAHDEEEEDNEAHARLARGPSRNSMCSSADGTNKDWEQSRSWNPMEAENCWPDYCAMNGLFAQKVVEIYAPSDVVWVQDYHLLLLPNCILRKLPNACCGLFLHVPFPSSEIFRTLAAREEILRAMLCADHIGFNLYEYARHFLTCCSRMLGLEEGAKRGGVLFVDNQGRDVTITCSHIGFHTEFVERRLTDPATQALVQRIALNLGTTKSVASKVNQNKSRLYDEGGIYERDMQVIVSVDEVEGLRGLSLKLLALDRLFTDYAHLRGRVVLRQVGLTLDSRPDDYNQCRHEVEGLVQLLTDKWGPVVQYSEHTEYELTKRLALFQNCDVYLCTAVRMGVDLFPFEYLIARRQLPGCIITSEFSAASRVLHGSLRINPFKTAVVAATIEEALTMSQSERTARAARDLDFVERNPIAQWCEHILADIRASHKAADAPLTRFGGGFGTRVLTLGDHDKQTDLFTADPPFLDTFTLARKRLVLLDYSGTLVETSPPNLYLKKGGEARTWHYTKNGKRRPGGCLETRDPISPAARAALIDLCRDPNNTVVVISADLRDELAHALQGITNLVLIAENGFVFRVNNEEGTEWVPAVDLEAGAREVKGQLAAVANGGDGEKSDGTESLEDSSEVFSEPGDDPCDEFNQWQELTRGVMENYANRTNGAFVWQSPAAVSFNYILSDPDLGSTQAKNLVLELQQLLAIMPLTVDEGKGFVTVRVRGVNRSTAIRELVSYLDQSYDFVSCFGDDNEDESSFGNTNKFRNVKDPNIKAAAFSIRVGGLATSKARYKVHDSAEVVEVLGKMAEALQSKSKVRRNFSLGDFNRQAGDLNSGAGDLGSFKTKQSYVALSAQDNEDIIAHSGFPARSFSSINLASRNQQDSSQTGMNGGGQKNCGGMAHSPSYVASAAEMGELFGSMSMPPHAGGGGSMPIQPLPSSPRLPEEDVDPHRTPPIVTGDGPAFPLSANVWGNFADEEEDDENEGGNEPGTSLHFHRTGDSSGGDLEWEFRQAMMEGSKKENKKTKPTQSQVEPVSLPAAATSLTAATNEAELVRLAVAALGGGLIASFVLLALNR